MVDPSARAALDERQQLLDVLDAVRAEHPLVSPYVLEHLLAAAVRAYIDTPEGGP